MSYTQLADWNKCTKCGDCLVKCPVMQMDKSTAIAEITNLLQTGYSDRIFKECTFCFRCNSFCPEGLRLNELILEKFLDAKKKKGKISALIPFLFNGTKPSMWQDLYSMLSKTEKSILKKWSEIPPPSKEILWVGCIGRLSCFDIENSTVLRELPKFGPADLCCGELPYRLGSWKAYSDTIEKTLKVFEKLNIERMVCYCGSCYNYLSNILKNVYGRELPFKLISMYEWLNEKRKSGQIQLKKPLHLKTTHHESCYVSELGNDFGRCLRDLYTSAGVEVVQLPHHGENNLSCGAVSVIRTLFLPSSLFKEQLKKYKDVKATGLRDMAVNCPGCFMTLAFTSWLAGIKLHYMPDDLLKAYGDTVTKPLFTRIPLFMLAFMKHPLLPLKRVDAETSPGSFYT
ncbi:MAG: (Fe-S)-binding protein [Syntrophaceae bacterium]|nr:(Fe-S)-binding protein [Syntrophaceae bacterium]